MKTFIAILMVLAFIVGTGCGQFINVKQNDLTSIAAGGLAAYLGYEGYKASPKTFDVAYDIATGEMDLNEKVNALRDQLTNEITDHPVLKRTATRLLDTIEVDVTVDVIDVTPEQQGLVADMILEFAIGIDMARGEV